MLRVSTVSLVFVLCGVPVWAATTGQVVITASVPQACNIVVSATAGASIANLTLGDTSLPVVVTLGTLSGHEVAGTYSDTVGLTVSAF